MTDLPAIELPSGERVTVEGTVVIGRGADADVVIADSEASRRHAQLSREGAACYIEDLGSRNGTAVNGVRVSSRQALADGDEVRVGQTSLRFHGLPAAPTGADMAVPDDDALATVVAPRIEATVRQEAAPPSPASGNTPMQVLGRITRAISTMDDAREIAGTVTVALRDEYGCDAASLLLLDPAGWLYFASVAADSPNLKLLALRRGEGIAGRAVEAKQGQLVVDAAADPGHDRRVDRLLGFLSRSIVAMPVFGTDGAAIGALEMINPRRKAAFDGDDAEFLGLVAMQLGPALSRAHNWEGIERERAALARVADIRRDFIAESPALIRLVMEAAALYEARTPIYLAGEPGTGKRALARLVHAASEGGAALLETSGEFPVAGAFHLTGLQDLPVTAQGHLAAVLAEAAGRRPVIVSGTGSLLSLLASGSLAPALHDVLEAGQLVVSPLRARGDEVEALTGHFAAQTAARIGREPYGFEADAAARLAEYDWPGNVAQLRAVVHRAGVLAREQTIELATLQIAAPELFEAARGPAPALPSPLARRRAGRLSRALDEAVAENPTERAGAARALGADGSPEALSALSGMLADPAGEVRVAAATALPLLADSAAALAARLEVEPELDVAMRLLEALGRTGFAAETPIVERAARAGDPRMRRLAMRLLRGGSAAVTAAEGAREDSDALVRAEAIAALIEAGQRLEDPLVALTGQAEDPAVRVRACELLGELGLAAGRLRELTTHEDRAVRVAAIGALGAAGGTGAVELLMDLLEDASVSADAAAALGRLGAAAAVPRLCALLSAPEAPALTREAIVRALARIPGSDSLRALQGAAEEPVLQAAVLEVAASVPELAADASLTGLRTRALMEHGTASPGAAIEALEGLVALASAGDRAAVIETVRSATSQAGRELALEFLVELDDPECAPALLGAREESAAAREGLARLGARAVPQLLALLDGPDAAAATEALGSLGAGVVGGLLPLLADREHARPASRAIVEVGAPALPALIDAIDAAEPALLPALLQVFGQVAPGRLAFYVASFLDAEDAPARYAALIALGNLPDARSEAEFLARLDSADAVERTLAVLGLGRIQSADGFEVLTGRVGMGDRRSQYALAGAINEYNLRQGPVLAIINRMVRDGLPFSSAAIESGFASGAITDVDLLAALHGERVPESQKLRLIAAVSRLPSEQAVGPLLAVVRADLPEAVLSAAVAAIGRHEVAARDAVAKMLLDPLTRDRGVRLLGTMQDPRSLMFVLRRIAPAIEADPLLREAVHSLGDLVLGPLVDVIAQNWDLEGLGLLWQLSGMVDPPKK